MDTLIRKMVQDKSSHHIIDILKINFHFEKHDLENRKTYIIFIEMGDIMH